MLDVTIKSYMRSVLCLKGRALMVYAIVYSLQNQEVRVDDKEVFEYLRIFYPESNMSVTRHFLRELVEDDWLKFDGEAYTIHFEEISRACV